MSYIYCMHINIHIYAFQMPGGEGQGLTRCPVTTHARYPEFPRGSAPSKFLDGVHRAVEGPRSRAQEKQSTLTSRHPDAAGTLVWGWVW